MCLEPFGATGLFIFGRGVLLLLLVGVVIEREEQKEKRGGGRMENSDEQAKSLLRELTSAPRSRRCHTALSEA